MIWRGLRWVMASEGANNPGAMNLNSDGYGLSFGLIQWVQGTGDLGVLLRYFAAQAPDAFNAIMGGPAAAQQVLSITNASDQSTRLSVPLWQDPWLSRFRVLGTDETFVKLQWSYLLSQDPHYQAAVNVTNALGWSERNFAIAFDRSVQQGIGAVRRALTAARASPSWANASTQQRGALFTTAARSLMSNGTPAARAADQRIPELLSSPELADDPPTGGSVPAPVPPSAAPVPPRAHRYLPDLPALPTPSPRTSAMVGVGLALAGAAVLFLIVPSTSPKRRRTA